MGHTGFLATALALLGLLAACGDEPAPVPSPPPLALGPIADVEPEPEPGPQPTDPPPVPEEPAQAGDEEWQPPQDWCGTGKVGGRWGGVQPGQWEELESGLWRRVFYDRRDRLVIEWGENRDGKFVTWREEESSEERPLFGTPRIPDRPSKRPPR